MNSIEKHPALKLRDRQHHLIRETLVRLAARRKLTDPGACRTVFDFVETGRAIQRHLLGALAVHRQSETTFGVLLVLLHFDPATVTAAQLAYHTGVSRSAMTDIVDRLTEEGWVCRRRSTEDRRTIHVGLNAAGREAVETAIRTLMTSMESLVRDVPEIADPRMARLCALVDGRLGQAQAAGN